MLYSVKIVSTKLKQGHQIIVMKFYLLFILYDNIHGFVHKSWEKCTSITQRSVIIQDLSKRGTILLEILKVVFCDLETKLYEIAKKQPAEKFMFYKQYLNLRGCAVG